MEARHAHARAAAPRLGHGWRGRPRLCRHHGEARRVGRAQPRGRPDPLRGRRREARRSLRGRTPRRHAPCRNCTEPINAELVARRIEEISAGGVLAAASLTPQRVEEYYQIALEAGLDVLIIQGTVVSAEHVSTRVEPLDLKKFISECEVPVIVGGWPATPPRCTSCAPAPSACSSASARATPAPRAACSASASRRRRPSPTPRRRACSTCSRRASTARHRRRRHRTGGDVSKAIALGADAVMIGSPLSTASEAPGRGYHWGMATFHPELPRGTRVKSGTKGTLQEILLGPATRTTARVTCSAPCAPAWRPAATRR